MTALSVGVTTLVTVTRWGDKWATRTYDIAGSVDIPAAAVPSIDEGARCFVWHETPHMVDPKCPVCMSASVCVQEVTLYPDSGGILVVHESDGAPEVN